MPENVACPQCARPLRVAENLLGKKVKCPACQNIFVAAAPGAATKPAPHEDDVRDLPRKDAANRLEDDFDDDEDDRRVSDEDLAGIADGYRLDIGKWFSFASAHYGYVLGPMIGMMFVTLLLLIPVVLLIMAAMFIGEAVAGRGGALAAVTIAYVVWIIVNPALLYAVFGGFSQVSMAQLQGRPWSFGDFFAGFKHIGAFAVLGILHLGLMFVSFLPYGVVAASGIVDKPSPLGVLLAIAAYLFALIVFLLGWTKFCAFVVPLVMDRGLPIGSAIKANMAICQGGFWGLVLTAFLFWLVSFTGYCGCFVGLLFTAPLGLLFYHAAYLSIAGTQPPVMNVHRKRRRLADDDDYDD